MRYIVAALLGVLLLALVGCSAQERLRGANDLVGTAYGTIADGRDAGLIEQKDIAPYLPARRRIDSALDAAGERLRRGDAVGMDSQIAVVKAALQELKPLLDLIPERRKVPRAKPTTRQ